MRGTALGRKRSPCHFLHCARVLRASGAVQEPSATAAKRNEQMPGRDGRPPGAAGGRPGRGGRAGQGGGGHVDGEADAVHNNALRSAWSARAGPSAARPDARSQTAGHSQQRRWGLLLLCFPEERLRPSAACALRRLPPPDRRSFCELRSDTAGFLDVKVVWHKRFREVLAPGTWSKTGLLLCFLPRYCMQGPGLLLPRLALGSCCPDLDCVLVGRIFERG